jgi:hypothetical protein
MFEIPQNDEFIESAADFWRDVRAFAVDSKDRIHFSRKVKFGPTWGSEPGRDAKKFHRQGKVLRFAFPVSPATTKKETEAVSSGRGSVP